MRYQLSSSAWTIALRFSQTARVRYSCEALTMLLQSTMARKEGCNWHPWKGRQSHTVGWTSMSQYGGTLCA